ncbi:MAG TPA: amino acid permease [Alicyclobacillus sp.]|nr:amino acid permease [Alicyclobacillus sp.]
MIETQMDRDSHELSQFGYKQELKRALGLFSNFSVAFTYLSPVVGIYSLYAYGLQTGGPTFIWSIPIVVLGQLMVALVFSELATTYPLSGALYQWARRLLSPGYGWFVGWIYTWALLVTIASVDFGGAPYVAAALGFSNPSQNTLILITVALLVTQTLINLIGVNLLRQLAILGTFMEFIGTVVIAVVLLFFHHQPDSVVFSTGGVQGNAAYLPLFVLASLFSAWIFFGFESAGDVAEEVVDPRRKVPKAMILTLIVGGIVSFLLTYALLVSTPDMGLAMDGTKTPDPVTYILTSNLGDTVGRMFLWIIILAYLSCGASIQAATTRVIYSYARDRVLPGYRLWSYISPTHQTPRNALVLSAILAFLFCLSAKVESILTSFAVEGIYLAFQLVMLAALIARLKGWKPQGYFNLGVWAWPVNILGLIYGIAMMINVARPINWSLPWYLNYDVLLSTAGVIVVGAVVYLTQRKALRQVHAPLITTGQPGHDTMR